MRRFYALGVLVTTAVVAVFGFRVTEARACNIPTCNPPEQLYTFSCSSDICGNGSGGGSCGFCIL